MKFKLKDPGSAITHGIALLLAVAGAIPLIVKAARSYDVIHIVALSIFILSMILLYAASTIYHSVDSTEKVNRRLRKMDHMMIFVMIAGSYSGLQKQEGADRSGSYCRFSGSGCLCVLWNSCDSYR